MGTSRTQRRSSRRLFARDEGGRPVDFFLAFGDRGIIPADLYFDGPGGTAVQSFGLVENVRHGLRRVSGGDVQSGDTDAFFACEAVSRAMAGDKSRGRRTFGRKILSGRQAPGQPCSFPLVRTGMPFCITTP